MRPIMHRASMVEIIVPYGDPRHPFQHKCAFDVMDYGLGFTANSLELGCDCLGHIKYFDGMVNNAKGMAHMQCAGCLSLYCRACSCLHPDFWLDAAASACPCKLSFCFTSCSACRLACQEYAMSWLLLPSNPRSHMCSNEIGCTRHPTP